MCGIVAMLAEQDVVPQLVEGLRRLEYRGYDSAGVAVHAPCALRVRKSQGKVADLERVLEAEPLSGLVGVAHTRWATHGAASRLNAHPHLTESLALVHNGIIENHEALREELRLQGFKPKSQTDSEVLALLIERELGRGVAALEALRAALKRVEGSYAVCVLFREDPAAIFGAKRGSPLCAAEGGALASDPMALPERVESFHWLQDGEVCIARLGALVIQDESGQPVSREALARGKLETVASKGEHKHFMHKEIYEQPLTIRRTLREGRGWAVSPALQNAESVTLLACGTSYHAALVAAEWFEALLGIPARAELASEFRYAKRALGRRHVAVAISQSGETADTLAALNLCKERDVSTLAFVNVAHSSMAQLADETILTHAGQEVGVASTKAFTAQLCALLQLVLNLARARGSAERSVIDPLQEALDAVHQDVDVVLALEPQFASIARRIARAGSLFLIGRGTMHAMALEGALKVKETSYIHAEGFAAGELKHGSIALIEPGTPVLVLAPDCELSTKTRANAEEVASRGAEVIYLESLLGEPRLQQGRMRLPRVPNELAPIIFAVALQLISYHAAVECRTNVDQPRNLAKSVTVE